MTESRPIAGVLLSGALLLLGACGGGESGPPPQQQPSEAEKPAPTAKAPGATVKISATDFKLDPATVRVKQPGSVRFELDNAGQAPHALEVEGPKGEVETQQIAPGKTGTVVAELDKPGTYTMYCPVGNHKGMGMTGKIVVAGG